MLKSIFDLLDRHPSAFWFVASVPTLWLLVRIFFLIGRECKQDTLSKSMSWRIDALLLLILLLAWRWPFLLVAHDFNPDESQLIAGAITLTHDPVFWRSVDGTTSGPLNFYALLPLHWLGLPLDYFSARLTGLLLIWGALLACQRALTHSFGRTMGWLGILPATGFFCTVTHLDLIHYSSEHLSLFLIALSWSLLAIRQPGGPLRWWAALFIAGTAPWAKLQSVPLALVLIAWGCIQRWTEAHGLVKLRLQRLAHAGLAASAPTLIAAALIIVTGQGEAAFRRYFLHNLIYVGQGNESSMLDALLEMKGFAMLDGRFPLFAITTSAGILAACLVLLWRRERPPTLFLTGAALTLAAILAVIMPGREFLHYVLLLVVPLTVWFGAATAAWWARNTSPRVRVVLAAALLIAGLAPLITRTRQPVPDIFGGFAYHWRHPRGPVSMVVNALVGREGALGIWGWAPHLYVETGLPQATRDAHTVWSIVASAQRDYHRRDYLADLQRSQPAIFVDAVGPAAFAFEHRELQAHETFPALSEFIASSYTLLRDVRDARIYVRNGLPALADLSPRQIDLLLAKGRDNERNNTAPPAITPLENLTRKVIDYRPVMMILPPTAVEWRLDNDVREVSFEFGFDPIAYEQGESNGAEVILELASFENTRQVFSRFLDPSRREADRGRQAAHVTLPPYHGGTHLILRTTPGPSTTDNAWDWVYFTNLKLRRNPTFLPRQFPGFNRVPDHAHAGNSGLIDDERDKVFQLHAPGSLTFALKGSERQLNFSYGFSPGAHTDGGYTDGAIYRVELLRLGEPAHVLFERHLRPTRQATDRGRQTATVVLPATKSGDQLVLTVDPGPSGSAAWDWTCIYRFTLE